MLLVTQMMMMMLIAGVARTMPRANVNAILCLLQLLQALLLVAMRTCRSIRCGFAIAQVEHEEEQKEQPHQRIDAAQRRQCHCDEL